MLKVLPKVHFYGEFGCLNYSILANIEERQPAMIISTQPDYFKLMHMKCNRIVYDGDRQIYVPKLKAPGFTLVPKEQSIYELEEAGFVSLHKFLEFETERCISYLKHIKNPLTQDIGLPIDQQYISISFRNRTHQPDRNLHDEEWLKIIAIIRRHTDLPIVAHGMDMDTKTIDGTIKTKTIEESIAYMNKSKVFIASMSGIAQFASNCACGIIQIGDVKRHFDYDPFQKGCVAVAPDDFEQALIQFIK